MSRRAVPGPASPLAGGNPDDQGCDVLHVDMDAFYAAVEVRRRPELRGLPVVVGGTGGRGVVLSATYEARTFGVHSAMPIVRARRLCPQAVFVRPDMATYAAVSRGVMEVFRSVTPLVEPLSLDEAFLGVAGVLRRFGSPTAVARWVRARVEDEQGVTCSVGVAPSKFVAKLASAAAKPDGLLVVPATAVVEFLHPLPTSALWGVGEVTEEKLGRLGLRTVGDVAVTSRATLERALGPAAGAHLHALSWGRDDRSVEPEEPDRSLGAEETFGRDVDDPAVVRRELLRLSDRTAARLRATSQVGRTVVLKVRFADFTTITRSRTLRESTDVGRVVYETARELFEALGLQRARIRLVGVRVEGLAPADAADRQLTFDTTGEDWREAERAVDRASRRFGPGVVRPAALVTTRDASAPPPTRPGRSA